MFSLRFSYLFLFSIACSTSPLFAADETGDAQKPAEITSKVSLVHLGSIDTFTITEQGTLAGRFLLSALDSKDLSYAKKAKEIYETIIPIEHYGGKYTALEWFCYYLLRTENIRTQKQADPYPKTYFA